MAQADVIDQKTFARLKQLIYDLAGIEVKPGKEALVTGRLQKRMRELKLATYASYLDLVEANPDGDEVILLLDAISTNVTSFYREREHFDLLGREAARWAAEGRDRIRIWCAASSTGEEPYTIAMTVAEAMQGRRADVRVLATDISTRVLAIAERGTYTRDACKSIPETLKSRWFSPTEGGMLRVQPQLRAMVQFARVNLAKPPYPMRGPLDAVFCRNVMIYFDNPVRSRIVGEVRRLVRPGGLLCVGHAESLGAIQGDLATIQPAAYRIPE